MAPMRFTRIKIESDFRKLEKITAAVERNEETYRMACAGSGQKSEPLAAVAMPSSALVPRIR